MCDHCGCRSFPPIAELTADHEEILRLAWDLAETARSGARADSRTRDALVALLDAHVAKEETGLYPSLLVTGGLSQDQVELLEDEHRVLRRELVGSVFDRRAFYALAAHIEDEEMELFPAAMLGFDDEEWEATSGAHRAVHDAAVPAAS